MQSASQAPKESEPRRLRGEFVMTIAAHIAGEVVDVVGTWIPVTRSVSAREVRPVQESGVASSTQGAALSLLSALDTDAVRAEGLYADVFRRLTKYFGRRGAREPEDLARETITWGLRRISGGGTPLPDPSALMNLHRGHTRTTSRYPLRRRSSGPRRPLGVLRLPAEPTHAPPRRN
jgi:hypothetical protein